MRDACDLTDSPLELHSDGQTDVMLVTYCNRDIALKAVNTFLAASSLSINSA